MFRLSAILMASSVLAVAAQSFPARAAETPPTAAHLKALYAKPPSKFIKIDGVDMHVRDEGRGPVLVLLNGHLGNLHMFDAWTAVLVRDGFRVVRVDWPPYGLSLPDPKGEYSTARATELVAGLLDRMKLGKVSLVGTSNGATVAAHYAALHPDRVDRLALSTFPLGKPGPREVLEDLKQQFALYGKADYRPESFYRAVLSDIFADPKNVTPEIVKLYTDVNNYPGGYAAVDDYIQHNLAMYAKGDFLNLYKRVRAPTLIQSGDKGKVLPPSAAEAGAAALPNAPVMVVIHYPGSGHMPMLEQPQVTVTDLIAFLRGQLDSRSLPRPAAPSGPVPPEPQVQR